MRKLNSGVFTSASAEWRTPPHVFAMLDAEFHFTLDPCATKENALCRRFFTQETDGLAQPWAPERVFVNPPYGDQVGAWMEKAREEAVRGALVCCLIAARCDTAWWHRWVMRATEIRLPDQRIRFLRPDGTPATSPPFPSAFVVFRPYWQGEQPPVLSAVHMPRRGK